MGCTHHALPAIRCHILNDTEPSKHSFGVRSESGCALSSIAKQESKPAKILTRGEEVFRLGTQHCRASYATHAIFAPWICHSPFFFVYRYYFYSFKEMQEEWHNIKSTLITVNLPTINVLDEHWFTLYVQSDPQGWENILWPLHFWGFSIRHALSPLFIPWFQTF